MTDLAVARRYRFNAQHHVPELAAPWGVPHWHDYTVEVVAAGDSTNDALMVVDTDRIDAAWKRLGPHNAANLNDLYEHTTVEWLAHHWLGALRADVGPVVQSVTVWEDNGRWGRAWR